MDLKGDIPKRCLRRISGRLTGRVGRFAAFSILTGTVIASTIAIGSGTDEAAPSQAVDEIIPYYMTQEYQDMKRQEQEEANAEAEALRKSIEDYRAEQERIAEEEFKAMQDGLYQTADVGADEEPYPFNTMSQDWGADDIEGFIFYEIPEEYALEGGYFPEVMQVYLWCVCRDMGMDYPTAVAMIEQESGYQYDEIGNASDSGYFQVVPKYHKDRMKRLRATDMLNPYQNALVAIDYMVELLDKYGGSYKKALTAYNYGPEGAYKYFFSAGVDANDYAKSVLKKADRIRRELDAAKD